MRGTLERRFELICRVGNFFSVIFNFTINDFLRRTTKQPKVKLQRAEIVRQ